MPCVVCRGLVAISDGRAPTVLLQKCALTTARGTGVQRRVCFCKGFAGDTCVQRRRRQGRTAQNCINPDIEDPAAPRAQVRNKDRTVSPPVLGAWSLWLQHTLYGATKLWMMPACGALNFCEGRCPTLLGRGMCGWEKCSTGLFRKGCEDVIVGGHVLTAAAGGNVHA